MGGYNSVIRFEFGLDTVVEWAIVWEWGNAEPASSSYLRRYLKAFGKFFLFWDHRITPRTPPPRAMPVMTQTNEILLSNAFASASCHGLIHYPVKTAEARCYVT